MDSIWDTEYAGRRGGVEDITKRHPNLISTEDEINGIICLREAP
jgi:hypothetical protein